MALYKFDITKTDEFIVVTSTTADGQVRIEKFGPETEYVVHADGAGPRVRTQPPGQS